MEHDVTSLRGRRAIQRWNRVSVGDILERQTWSHPEKDAFIGRDGAFSAPEFERLTYRQADALANRIANRLLAEGLENGDRVMLFCDNSVEALVSLFGIAKAGLVAVPVNPHLAPDVITWMIGNIEPRFSIVDASVWLKLQEPFAQASFRVGTVIAVDGEIPEGVSGFADWIAESPDTEPDVEIHADDVWSLMHTSGTTALPKASMNTHVATTVASYDYALSYTRGLDFEQQIRMCTYLPVVHHVTHNESIIPALVAGGTVIVGRKLDAARLAGAITAERATAVWVGSPLFLEGLVRAAQTAPDQYDLSSLTSMMFAWNTISSKLHNELKDLCAPGFKLFEVLGQTESLIASRFWLEEWPEKVEAGGKNYIGRPTALSSTTIVDELGNDLRGQPGVTGEVVYRSPAVSTGYYRNEEATREAFRDGWFHSGDCCEYDEDGLLVMVDRFKDIVKSGGENVSSLRVEATLIEHPDVALVAVVGVADERWGERVTAIVMPAPGAEPNADEIIAFGREKLAGFETPKEIVFVDDMPRTVTGKILKHRLRESLDHGKLM